MNIVEKTLSEKLVKMLEGKIQEEKVWLWIAKNEESIPWHSNLSHYFSDADIRENNNEYKEMQNREMKKFIENLKVNNYENLSKISFLEGSKLLT